MMDFMFAFRLLARLAVGLLLAVTGVARGDEAKPADAPPAAKITYDEHVRPIFREHCFSCHNQDTKKSDLSLASFAAVMQGGSTGAVVSPGDADSSRLWSLVSHEDEPKMPPNQDKLAAAKLETIKAWIAGGALENNGSVAKAKKQSALAM
ncbi:MAG TPA: c-type cytochrome domain-containing protein, partial [Pirellulales bacterium]|nr:c-type cytochrome domain-containing protein [Pirellulales bacterium]